MLGTLHLPDFFKIVESIENCESKEDTMKVLKKLFKFFDENGDGKLSKAEAKIGFERMDLWKGEMDEVFEELKDDQGKVSIKGEMTCVGLKLHVHIVYTTLNVLPLLLDLMKHMEEDIDSDSSDSSDSD